MEGRPLDERYLIERAKRGDANAYADLVQRYQETAFRLAYLIVREAAEAEDAAQEAFIKTYYHLAQFRPDAAFRPWLLAIVANEARNRRVASARRAGLTLRTSAAHPSGDAAPSPEAALLAQEQRQLLLTALEQLREEERLAVAYRYFLDLSEAEMAQALHCARGTVKSRLSRALGHLRAVLERTSADAEARQTGEAPHG